MIWTKATGKKFNVKDYLDLESKDLLKGDLILIDHNEMLYLYKRELEITEFGVYFTQYYFQKSLNDPIQKLSKLQLLETYRYSGCFLNLQLFLNSENILGLNEDRHYRLFDIINSHTEKKAYQLLKYEAFLSKSS